MIINNNYLLLIINNKFTFFKFIIDEFKINFFHFVVV